MPNWNEVLQEILIEQQRVQDASAVDLVRRRYLKHLSEYTGRNVIAYYSGWLQRPPNMQGLQINDDDKNALMSVIHGMDRSKGLDLILHTPGGDIAATESIVHYLRSMFGFNMRAIIPQIAMSAGTMISCACNSIVMGKQSNIGPIDPQYYGVPAHAVVQEFKQAVKEITEDPNTAPLWQVIIGKYGPTFLGECQKSMIWSEEIVTDWLATGMFRTRADSHQIAESVVKQLSDHHETRTHSRHIHLEDAIAMGLTVVPLEEDSVLQDLVLTVHHAFMHTFHQTPAIKLVENQDGVAMVLHGNFN